MIITFDTEKLSERDLTVLIAILGQKPTEAPAEKEAPVKEKTPVKEEQPELPFEAEFTMADAVEVATRLVSEGKAADVKKALAGVGAKRVSELSEKDIPAFLESLK